MLRSAQGAGRRPGRGPRGEPRNAGRNRPVKAACRSWLLGRSSRDRRWCGGGFFLRRFRLFLFAITAFLSLGHVVFPYLKTFSGDPASGEAADFFRTGADDRRIRLIGAGRCCPAALLDQRALVPGRRLLECDSAAAGLACCWNLSTQIGDSTATTALSDRATARRSAVLRVHPITEKPTMDIATARPPLP